VRRGRSELVPRPLMQGFFARCHIRGASAVEPPGYVSNLGQTRFQAWLIRSLPRCAKNGH